MAKMIDKERSYLLVKAAQLGMVRAKEELGNFFLNMINAILSRPEYNGYFGDQRQEMIDEALYQCSLSINRYKPDKNCTPYSYFQMIICRAFIRASSRFRIKADKNAKVYAVLKFDYMQDKGGY